MSLIQGSISFTNFKQKGAYTCSKSCERLGKEQKRFQQIFLKQMQAFNLTLNMLVSLVFSPLPTKHDNFLLTNVYVEEQTWNYVPNSPGFEPVAFWICRK